MKGSAGQEISISGYFEIGLFYAKKEVNVGTLWRSAHQLGAAGIFTIGRRYQQQASDITKSKYHIPLRHYETFDECLSDRPEGAVLVGIETGGIPLSRFRHPTQAIYLLGAEDYGLPKKVLRQCNVVVSLESIGPPSYNVAVAGSIVMYHRVFLNKE